MSSIFVLNFNATINNNLPPDKRGSVDAALLNSSMYPLQWQNNAFTEYRTGATYTAYNAGTTYAIGTVVSFNKAIYESLTAGNIGNQPDISPASWYQRQVNFIGADERIRYRASKTVLEYALNKWYGTTFRQPNTLSDIYITTNTVTIPTFLSGKTESYSSITGKTISSGFVPATGSGVHFTPVNNFTIYFPSAVYAAIVGGDNTIRQFVDKYSVCGLVYNITTY